MDLKEVLRWNSTVMHIMASAVGLFIAFAIFFVLAAPRMFESGSYGFKPVWPIGLAAFAGMMGAVYTLCYKRAYRFLMPRHRETEPTQGRINWLGIAMMLVSLTAMLYAHFTY
jgi:hypothetical protein